MPHEKTNDAGQAPVGLAALVPAKHWVILEPSLPRGRLPDLEHVKKVDERQSEPPDPADWEKNVGNVFEDLRGNQPVRWVAMTRRHRAGDGVEDDATIQHKRAVKF